MLTLSQKEEFNQNGYYVIERMLETDLLARICHAFDLLEGYRNLLDHDITFLSVANHPILVSAIESILESRPQLLQFDGIARQPNTPDQGWHADFTFYCDRPLMLNVGVYLDELTADNGPICVVPGSHKHGTPPPRDPRDAGNLPDELRLTVPAGTAVIFDCTTWHRGGGNRSDKVRRAIFPTYGHYWMKRFETWMPYASEERFPETTSPELQALLGIALNMPSAYGGYDEKAVVRKGPDGKWESS